MNIFDVEFRELAGMTSSRGIEYAIRRLRTMEEEFSTKAGQATTAAKRARCEQYLLRVQDLLRQKSLEHPEAVQREQERLAVQEEARRRDEEVDAARPKERSGYFVVRRPQVRC